MVVWPVLCRGYHWSAVLQHLSCLVDMPVLTTVTVCELFPVPASRSSANTTGSGMNLLDISNKQWSHRALEVSLDICCVVLLLMVV